MPSVGSSLLLRIFPHTFAFIPIPSMILSSLNRSNCKAFRHIIMPYSAPLCKALHYSKTRVPWHTNNILIFINFLLVEFEMPHFAHVFGFLFDKRNVDLSSGHSTLCTYKGKSRQNKSDNSQLLSFLPNCTDCSFIIEAKPHS